MRIMRPSYGTARNSLRPRQTSAWLPGWTEFPPYLSLSYTTVRIPAWIIAFAHSLQGKRETYSFVPPGNRHDNSKIAFSSLCVTKGYFVRFLSLSFSLSQGNSSSEQPFGEAVVSHGQNLVVRADNAGSHLGIRSLTAFQTGGPPP